MNSRHRCAKIAYLVILLSVWSTVLWGMDEKKRELERCVLGGLDTSARAQLFVVKARSSLLSIDKIGDELIELIQAPGFTPNIQNPGPRPEIESPVVTVARQLLDGSGSSLFLSRIREARQRRAGKDKLLPESPLTMGRVIPKIFASQFRRIPAGVYFIGEQGNDQSGRPQGMWVRLNRDLYVQRGPVSRAQFEEVVGYDAPQRYWEKILKQADRDRNTQQRTETWRQATQIPKEERGNYPVTSVTYPEADNFVKELGDGFRLPTEWEQMIIMQAEREGLIPDDVLMSEAIHTANSENRLHETGSLNDNPFGLKDALGNAWQLSGSYHMFFSYPVSTRENPVDIDELARRNPQTGSRVGRGGGWGHAAPNYRPGNRRRVGSDYHDDDLSFRVVMTVEE